MPPSTNTLMNRVFRSARPRFRKPRLHVLYRRLRLNGHFLRTHVRRRPKCLPSLPRRMQLVVRQLELHGLRTPLQVLGFSLVGQCLQSQRKSLPRLQLSLSLLLLRLQLSLSLFPNLLLLRLQLCPNLLLLRLQLFPNLLLLRLQLCPNLLPLLPRLPPRRWLRRPPKKTNGSPRC